MLSEAEASKILPSGKVAFTRDSWILRFTQNDSSALPWSKQWKRTSHFGIGPTPPGPAPIHKNQSEPKPP